MTVTMSKKKAAPARRKADGQRSRREAPSPASENVTAPICVIDMPRGGTSMIARLLSFCGLKLDTSTPEPCEGDAGNLQKRDENRISAVSEALVIHLGGAWDKPPDVAQDWEYDPSLADLVEEAKAAIQRFPAGSPWGWKDSTTSLVLPFWKSLVPDLRFVICVRSPVEVAWSLRCHDRMPMEEGSSLWLEYTKRMITETAGCPRIVVFHEDLFDNWRREVSRLTDFCGLGESEDISRIENIVSSELGHRRSGLSEVLNTRKLDVEAKAAYVGLRAIAANGASEDLDRWLALLREVSGLRAQGEETPTSDRQYDVWKARAEGLEREREKWRHRAQTLDAVLSDKDSQIGMMIERAGQLEAERALLSATVGDKMSQVENSSQHATNLEKEINKLVPHLKNLDREIAEKARTIEQLKAQVTAKP